MAGTEQVQKTMSLQPGLVNRSYSVIDGYETLEDVVEAMKVGESPASSSLNLTIEGRLVNAVLERLPGGKGKAVIMTTSFLKKDVWGLDMTEIQKPIRAWKYDDSSDKPNLHQIDFWEKQKADGNKEAYESFKYDGKTAMTGNTLKLAKMIHQGIQYFSLFTPVITCTTRLTQAEIDGGAEVSLTDIGKVFQPSQIGCPTMFQNAAASFLKTGDRITGALDGTYTRVQTWTGADAWNPDLYGTAPTS